jgi:3-hydroxyisobutyrate dehydrogenase-like beta-hydroxyacid dehydrogenase
MTEASKKIAFIGTGKMGLPMSVLVAKAGYAVTAFDQSAARLAAAREQGISVATSPADAVGGRAVVITSLPDDAALRAVMLGPAGLIAAMAPRSILIETSTVSAEASGEVRGPGARDRPSTRAGLGKREHRSHRRTDLFRLGPQGNIRKR